MRTAALVVGHSPFALALRYYKRGLLNLTKMDNHIAKMLNDGWEILTQTSHTGDRRILRPFAKRDTITVSFRKS